MTKVKRAPKLALIGLVLVASAASANGGRYDRGYANDGVMSSCIVAMAYQNFLGDGNSPRAMLACRDTGF